MVDATSTFPIRESALDHLGDLRERLPQWVTATGLLRSARHEPQDASWATIRWALSDASRQLFLYYFTSEQVDELSCDLCRLAFTWSIPFLDKNGCLVASPKKLRGMIFPLRPDVSDEVMKGFIEEWIEKGLVLTYAVNGGTYLIYPTFLDHQHGLRRKKEGATSIPLPPDDVIAKCSALSTELVRTKDGVSPPEEKIRE